jgi:hypothetical protein
MTTAGLRGGRRLTARSRGARAGGGLVESRVGRRWLGEVTRGRDTRSRAHRGRGAGWLDRLVGLLSLGDE